MSTRLLSFLSDIERAVIKESAANMGPTWQTQRMVNFKDGLARMTLACADAEPTAPGGTIFLQRFLLADGSFCLKVNLAWDGSPANALIAVYAKPQVDWSAEARQIGSAWLAGPPATATATELAPAEAGAPLAAVAS